MKVHIIPGNGAGDVQNCMWYPWVKNKLNNAGRQICKSNR